MIIIVKLKLISINNYDCKNQVTNLQCTVIGRTRIHQCTYIMTIKIENKCLKNNFSIHRNSEQKPANQIKIIIVMCEAIVVNLVLLKILLNIKIWSFESALQ